MPRRATVWIEARASVDTGGDLGNAPVDDFLVEI